jgi:acetyltransferase
MVLLQPNLIDVWRAQNGQRFTLRLIRPADWQLLGNLIERASQAARYNRFHSAVRSLPADVLQGMTHVDYRRQLALVVTTRLAGEEIIVADVRYVVEQGEQTEQAEFAILVDDQFQRLGLGMRAMAALGAAAYAAGIRCLYGSVLGGNSAMLALTRRCGFSRAADPEDRRLVQVRSCGETMVSQPA